MYEYFKDLQLFKVKASGFQVFFHLSVIMSYCLGTMRVGLIWLPAPIPTGCLSSFGKERSEKADEYKTRLLKT